MINYAHRAAAFMLVFVAVLCTVFYRMALHNDFFTKSNITDVTAGLICLWGLAAVLCLIALSEYYQNNYE